MSASFSASLFLRRAFSGGLVGLAFFATACFEPPEELVAIPMVGLAEEGSSSLRAALLAVEEVNASGGTFAGRLFEWKTGANAGSFLNDGNRFFISADDVIAEESAATLSTQALHISASSSDALAGVDPAGDRWTFSTQSPARFVARIYAQLFAAGASLPNADDTGAEVNIPSCTQSATATLSDAKGVAFFDAFEGDFQARGGRLPVALQTSFSEENQASSLVDFALSLATVDDAVPLCVLLDVPVEFAKNWAETIASELNGRAAAWSILSSERSASGDLASASIPVTHLFSLARHMSFDEEHTGAFSAAFQARFGANPSEVDAAIYDAALLLAVSLVAAGDTDHEHVRDVLQDVGASGVVLRGPDGFAAIKAALANGDDIDYQGPSGEIDFDDEGEVQTAFTFSSPLLIDGELVWAPLAKIATDEWD
ncbi:MAG: hypothetical protein GY822_30320 [Deltaproteobacteria bacterium]|nr:hypothetical protein [Deltaproteobacteria bacterium]